MAPAAATRAWFDSRQPVCHTDGRTSTSDLGHIPHQVVTRQSRLPPSAALPANACTYLARNWQNRSRCSTTIRWTDGSRSSERNLRRCSLNADDSVTHLSGSVAAVTQWRDSADPSVFWIGRRHPDIRGR